jgi:hypothetical protein
VRRLARATVEESLRSYSDAIAQHDEGADGFPGEAFAAMADAGRSGSRSPRRAAMGSCIRRR